MVFFYNFKELFNVYIKNYFAKLNKKIIIFDCEKNTFEELLFFLKVNFKKLKNLFLLNVQVFENYKNLETLLRYLKKYNKDEIYISYRNLDSTIEYKLKNYLLNFYQHINISLKNIKIKKEFIDFFFNKYNLLFDINLYNFILLNSPIQENSFLFYINFILKNYNTISIEILEDKFINKETWAKKIFQNICNKNKKKFLLNYFKFTENNQVIDFKEIFFKILKNIRINKLDKKNCLSYYKFYAIWNKLNKWRIKNKINYKIVFELYIFLIKF